MSSTVTELHFEIRTNADWMQPFTIYDYDAALNQRTLHDFGGESLRMQVKGPIANRVIPTAVSLDLSTTNGLLMVGNDPTQGKFSINLSGANPQLNAMAQGEYVGDMLIFGANGSITPLFIARVRVHLGETVPQSS